jgi:hypothetical protein
VANAPINTADEAVAAARSFLQGTPYETCPFRVRAEQDFWLVIPQVSGEPVMVFVDAFNGHTAYYSEQVVDVTLLRPGG